MWKSAVGPRSKKKCIGTLACPTANLWERHGIKRCEQTSFFTAPKHFHFSIVIIFKATKSGCVT
jgi:hypothetical protein